MQYSRAKTDLTEAIKYISIAKNDYFHSKAEQ